MHEDCKITFIINLNQVMCIKIYETITNMPEGIYQQHNSPKIFNNTPILD